MKSMQLFNKKLIKQSFYSTSYFTKTKNILLHDNNLQTATMQFKTFYDEPFMLCGIKEILSILKNTLSHREFKQLTIYYYEDGTIVQPNSCVLSITGPYVIFCEYENIFDSILARRSSVSTNCWNVLKLIDSNQLLFMSDRSDDYQLQPFDGYAAYVAGVRKFSNKSHISLLPLNNDAIVIGTMPHALIQQYNGDIVKTILAYHNFEKQNITVLVDYENDIIHTLEQLIPHFNIINAIRIDTSSSLIDKSLSNYKNKNEVNGVNPTLVKLVRKFLDKNHGEHIKIIISSGLNQSTIKHFLSTHAPVDSFGIGSELTKLRLHFTADLVKLNNDLCSKFGRKYISEKNMKLYEK